jgi:hypothetical protein
MYSDLVGIKLNPLGAHFLHHIPCTNTSPNLYMNLALHEQTHETLVVWCKFTGSYILTVADKA